LSQYYISGYIITLSSHDTSPDTSPDMNPSQKVILLQLEMFLGRRILLTGSPFIFFCQEVIDVSELPQGDSVMLELDPADWYVEVRKSPIDQIWARCGVNFTMD
jgi:hypothetical protein